MIQNLERKFQLIGAKVIFVEALDTRWQTAPVRLNIIKKRGKEHFQISVRKDLKRGLDLSVLEVKSEDRHLVLLARHVDSNGIVSKDHFLCGHDERHLFVASVDGVSTVNAAKDSLKPDQIRANEIGRNNRKRNRRKTSWFKRQGEWFFIPTQFDPATVGGFITRDEKLSRGGGKNHVVQLACRYGGETVMVTSKYPNGLTSKEYQKLIHSNPSARKYHWQTRQRNAAVYVKGRISHPDHATIVLDSWHRVMMNTEKRRSDVVAFLD